MPNWKPNWLPTVHGRPATPRLVEPRNTCSDGTSRLVQHRPATLWNRRILKQVHSQSPLFLLLISLSLRSIAVWVAFASAVACFGTSSRASLTLLAHALGVPFQLSGTVADVYRRAVQRYGPADGELLSIALLEQQAGGQLRHPSPRADPAGKAVAS